MHVLVTIFAVICVAVTLGLLGAGVWVWAVVVRNACTAFLSARATTTNPHNDVNVALSGIKLSVVAGKLGFEDATAHAVHPANTEIN
jgi:hypothetical protein